MKPKLTAYENINRAWPPRTLGGKWAIFAMINACEELVGGNVDNARKRAEDALKLWRSAD